MIRSCAKNIGRLLGGKCSISQVESRRTLTLLEHESMRLLQRAGVSVPEFDVALGENEAHDIAQRLGGKNLTVKAEVPEFVGDRTKGMFDSGLRGSIHYVCSPDEAKYIASKMLGSTLRTGAGMEKEKSSLCRHVLIRQRSYAVRKARVCIELDPDNGPVILGCKVGISDCKECKKTLKGPCPILKLPVKIDTGLTRDDALTMAKALGFQKSTIGADVLQQLCSIFISTDCQRLEVLSLIQDIAGKINCYDCNIVLDDNAKFRLQNAVSASDPRWQTERSPPIEAHYSDSRANIACIVNGSGLGMASIDSIYLNGGNTARCSEVGNVGQLIEAYQLMETLKSVMADPKIHAVLINIFDGISTEESISEGILRALHDLQLEQACIPIVLRLHGAKNSNGTNVADQLSRDIPTPIYARDDFDEAIKLVVDLAHTVANQRRILACQHYIIEEDEKTNILLKAAIANRTNATKTENCAALFT